MVLLFTILPLLGRNITYKELLDSSNLQSGLFGHYERIGSGQNVEFTFDSFNMEHNMLHFVNLDLTNVLGYTNIISSRGILTDLSCPSPGIVLTT